MRQRRSFVLSSVGLAKVIGSATPISPPRRFSVISASVRDASLSCDVVHA